MKNNWLKNIWILLCVSVVIFNIYTMIQLWSRFHDLNLIIQGMNMATVLILITAVIREFNVPKAVLYIMLALSIIAFIRGAFVPYIPDLNFSG